MKDILVHGLEESDNEQLKTVPEGESSPVLDKAIAKGKAIAKRTAIAKRGR